MAFLFKSDNDITPDDQMVTEDYIDDFEKNLSKGIMIMHNA